MNDIIFALEDIRQFMIEIMYFENIEIISELIELLKQLNPYILTVAIDEKLLDEYYSHKDVIIDILRQSNSWGIFTDETSEDVVREKLEKVNYFGWKNKFKFIEVLPVEKDRLSISDYERLKCQQFGSIKPDLYLSTKKSFNIDDVINRCHYAKLNTKILLF